MKLKTLAAAAALAAGVSQAQANLLVNGSFEQPALGGGWQVFGSIPGWQTTSGSGIEIQTSGVVVTAQDGRQYVELDSHSNSTMSQVLDTVVGEVYSLSFWYRPRTNGGGNDNGINVYWDALGANSLSGFSASSQVLNLENYISAQFNDWRQFQVSLTATSEWTALSFGADGANNSLGGFVDNAVLEASVSEPAALLLLGAGLLGLGAARRRC